MIEPWNLDQLGPSSYDVRLASLIRVPHLRDFRPIDLRRPVTDQTDSVDITTGFLLPQDGFILASTVERLIVPNNLVCRVEGKSSLARLGIQIHSAGFIDPGYRGTVTLEITNFLPKPVILYPDILIAQLAFEELSGKCERPYSGRYQSSEGAVASRYGQEVDAQH